MPRSAGEKTKTLREGKRKEKRAREQAMALYDIYDTSGFDKEFFILLQNQAPEDQKLGVKSPVRSVGLTKEKDEDTASQDLPPRRHWQKKKKKFASSSSLKKCTAEPLGSNKFKGKSESARAIYATAYTKNGDNDGGLASRYANSPLLQTPPASLPLDMLSSPSPSNKSLRSDKPARGDMEPTENNTPTRSGTPSRSLPTCTGMDSGSTSGALMRVVNGEPSGSPMRDNSREKGSKAIAGADERGYGTGPHTVSSSYNTEQARSFSMSSTRTPRSPDFDEHARSLDTAYGENNPSMSFRERCIQQKNNLLREAEVGKKRKEREEIVDSDSEDLRFKSRNANRKEKPLNENQTLESLAQQPSSSSTRAVQQLSPTEWSSDELGNQHGCRSQTRFLARLSIDSLASPMSMSPCQVLLKSSKEICTQVRAMSGISLPPVLETRMQTAGLESADNPPSSPGYRYHDNFRDPNSSIEVNSKYFYNKRGTSPGASTNHPSNNQLRTESGIITKVTPLNDCWGSPRPSEKKKTQKQPAKARPGSRAKKVSKYFPISKAAAGSSLPFPSTQRKRFGLIQESVAHDPFRLLVATIFLNKTKCEAANPIFDKVFNEFRTIESLAFANVDELASTIQPLGLHNQRARKIINLAKAWLSEPPAKGKRYRKIGYPKQQDGRDVQANECLDDEDPRVAWEVAHLPGIGPYAIDSWRIFCRDELRGLAADHKGTGATEGFVPEWKFVLPGDKELRAYLSWMWLREGYSWDMETGELTPADPRLKNAAARKNKACMLEDDLELSTQSRPAIVGDHLCTPAPSPGLRKEED